MVFYKYCILLFLIITAGCGLSILLPMAAIWVVQLIIPDMRIEYSFWVSFIIIVTLGLVSLILGIKNGEPEHRKYND
jgi:putative Mn2+ efflux pump MntP